MQNVPDLPIFISITDADADPYVSHARMLFRIACHRIEKNRAEWYRHLGCSPALMRAYAAELLPVILERGWSLQLEGDSITVSILPLCYPPDRHTEPRS